MAVQSSALPLLCSAHRLRASLTTYLATYGHKEAAGSEINNHQSERAQKNCSNLFFFCPCLVLFPSTPNPQRTLLGLHLCLVTR
jgi:hypothetical protein